MTKVFVLLDSPLVGPFVMRMGDKITFCFATLLELFQNIIITRFLFSHSCVE